jgi:Holliday junction resolvasome RuvABC DNA-binding subunit
MKSIKQLFTGAEKWLDDTISDLESKQGSSSMSDTTLEQKLTAIQTEIADAITQATETTAVSAADQLLESTIGALQGLGYTVTAPIDTAVDEIAASGGTTPAPSA